MGEVVVIAPKNGEKAERELCGDGLDRTMVVMSSHTIASPHKFFLLEVESGMLVKW